ncbi:hypothetical protein THAOC_01666, partial [Thalassiosira oceanica]
MGIGVEARGVSQSSPPEPLTPHAPPPGVPERARAPHPDARTAQGAPPASGRVVHTSMVSSLVSGGCRRVTDHAMSSYARGHQPSVHIVPDGDVDATMRLGGAGDTLGFGPGL